MTEIRLSVRAHRERCVSVTNHYDIVRFQIFVSDQAEIYENAIDIRHHSLVQMYLSARHELRSPPLLEIGTRSRNCQRIRRRRRINLH